MAKRKNLRQENIYLKQRIQELEAQLARLSGKEIKPVPPKEPQQKSERETLRGTSRLRTQNVSNYLYKDLRRSLLLTVLLLTTLVLLWYWSPQVFQYLPF